MELSNFQRYSIDLDATEIEHKSPRQLKGLLKEAQRGNTKAWDDLWLYGTKLVLKIVNKLNDLGLVYSFEDAVAEGNLAIGEALTRWNPAKAAFSTWVWIRVRGAVLNQTNKDMERDNAEQNFDVEVTNREGVEEDLSGVDLVVSPYGDPVRLAEHVEFMELVFNQLPDRERDVIVLRYFEDFTQVKVADMMDISRQMVDKIEKRALARLKESLEGGLHSLDSDG